MKRNETTSKSNLVMKLVAAAVAVALSACAVTGPGEMSADMPFNDVHHGS